MSPVTSVVYTRARETLIPLVRSFISNLWIVLFDKFAVDPLHPIILLKLRTEVRVNPKLSVSLYLYFYNQENKLNEMQNEVNSIGASNIVILLELFEELELGLFEKFYLNCIYIYIYYIYIYIYIYIYQKDSILYLCVLQNNKYIINFPY